MGEDDESLRRVQGREIKPDTEQEIDLVGAWKSREVLEEKERGEDVVEGVKEVIPGVEEVEIGEDGHIKRFQEAAITADEEIGKLQRGGKLDQGAADQLREAPERERIAKIGKILDQVGYQQTSDDFDEIDFKLEL